MMRQQNRSSRKIYAKLIFKMFAVTYLLFGIVFLLTLPTTAYFNDIETDSVTISAQDDFGEDVTDADMPSEGASNVEQQEKEPETQDKSNEQSKQKSHDIEKTGDTKKSAPSSETDSEEDATSETNNEMREANPDRSEGDDENPESH